MIDFPNVSSRAPAQTIIDGQLVKRVRIGVNSREPLVTRVVMEVAEGATYHVERAGTAGSDLAVVFEPAQSSKTVLVSAPLAEARRAEPEPDIPLEQAIANAAALTPKETPAADPVAPLKPAPVAARQQSAQVSPAPVAARQQSAPLSPPPVASQQSVPLSPPPVATRQQSAPLPTPPVVARQQGAPLQRAGGAPSANQQIISGAPRSSQGTPITLDSPGPICDQCSGTSTRSAA